MDQPNHTRVKDLEVQMARVRELRDLEAKAAEAKKEIMSQLEQEESRMLALLTECDLDSFKCKFGMVYKSYRDSIRTPKTPEDKQALFDFLKKLGVFDDMISVNSMTLLSFWKEQMQLARDRGDEEFKVPGINEVTTNEILNFRKG